MATAHFLNNAIADLRKARRFARHRFNELMAGDYMGHHTSHAAVKALEEADEKFNLGGFGVEGFTLKEYDDPNESINYINMGDTYDWTLMFDSRTDRFLVGSWGDLVESLERK